MKKKQFSKESLYISNSLTLNNLIAKQQELANLLRKHNYEEDDILDLTYALELAIIKKLYCTY